MDAQMASGMGATSKPIGVYLEGEASEFAAASQQQQQQ